VGGGTPTALGAAALRQLLGLIRSWFALLPQAEWTVEANPESLSDDVVEVLAGSGVNRVSVGVQTLVPALRQTLGRRGDPALVSAGLAALRRAGIARLNADLIYHIPGQTLSHWEGDLRAVLDLGVSHLSAYALTLEEGSRLATAALALPAEEAFEAMWQRTDGVTAEYGLRRYEISNFARVGAECQHNVGVWYGDLYLGCGPAAASFDGRQRCTNPPSLQSWLDGTHAEPDVISPRARAAEILAFGLRLVDGWDPKRFRQATGMALAEVNPEAIDELVALGLLERCPKVLRPTPAGLLLHDAMAGMILLDPGA
jgi:oxygen-independent coproporphyrinogen-3 oxidase